MRITEASKLYPDGTQCEGENCTNMWYVFFQTKRLCLGCYGIKLNELRVAWTKRIKNRVFDIKTNRYRNIFTGKFQKREIK